MPDEQDLVSDGLEDFYQTGQYDPNALVDPDTGENLEVEEDEPVEEPEAVLEEAVEDEPVEEPVAQTRTAAAQAIDNAVETVQKQQQPQRVVTSPYAAPILTDEEREEAELLFDEKQMGLMTKVIKRTVQQEITAHNQQFAEAKRTGASGEFFAEYGDDIRKFTQNVPEHMRGTSEGARLAMNMAIADRAMASGDMAAEYEKAARLMRGAPAKAVVQAQKKTAPPAPVKQLAPSQVVGRGAAGAVGAPAGVAVGAQRGIQRSQRTINKMLEALDATDSSLYRG